MSAVTVTLSSLETALVQQWREHQSQRPDVPDDYAAHVDHLRQRMDRWEATDQAYRTLVGNRLADAALALSEASA